MIRVAFRYNDSRLFARLVCLVRGGDSAHCEVAWSWAGERHECVSASWLDGGVRKKLISMPADKWRIYSVPGDQRHVEVWFQAHQGARYDVLGLLSGLVPRFGSAKRKWFCSEVCAHQLGLPNPHLFYPRELESVCARIGVRVQ